MKKLVAVTLAAVLLLAATAAPGLAAGTLTPGTYQAAATGYMGAVTVAVTVDESSIKNIEIVECTEEPKMIADAALPKLIADVMAYQAVNVDAVSGATFTSMAFKNAVTDALKQAGNNGGFQDKAAYPAVTVADAETDVLVIGGGGAGAMAAVAVKDPDFAGKDSGLSVILVEKLGFMGGSTMLAGGSIGAAVPLNSTVNAENEAMLDAYMTEAEWFAGSSDSSVPGKADRTVISAMLKTSGSLLLSMKEAGFPLITDGAMEAPESYSSVMSWVSASNEGMNDPGWPRSGNVITDFLNKQLAKTDVDVRLNTAATRLLTDENNNVIGAVVKTQGQEYNIYAKKVILATGGFAQDRALLEKYLPDEVDVIKFCTAGAHGDGLTMAEALGAQIVPSGILGYLGAEWRFANFSDLRTPFHNGRASQVIINKEGKRFTSDAAGFNWTAYADLLHQTDKTAYAIIDANHPGFSAAENTRLKDVVFKADTLEELVGKIKVDPAALTETIAAYNAIADGAEDAYGVTAQTMAPVLQAPFYAITIRPAMLGTYTGIQVDGNCRVLTADGTAIGNLYAAGETALHGAQFMLGAALYMGHIAGVDAANALQK